MKQLYKISKCDPQKKIGLFYILREKQCLYIYLFGDKETITPQKYPFYFFRRNPHLSVARPVPKMDFRRILLYSH